MQSSACPKYPVVIWRPAWDIGWCLAPIGLSIWLSLSVSPFLYPIAVFIIANRFLALLILCHEGLHCNLSRSKTLNDFLGRWLCAFPVGVSFSKYRRLHMMHHAAVNSDRWDPDLVLYDFYPISARKYFQRTVRSVLTLRMARSFLNYYVLPDSFVSERRHLASRPRHLTPSQESDLFQFVSFHFLALTFVVVFGLWREYLLFYFIPIAFVMQPYALLISGLQHGPRQPGDQPEQVSRSIRGPKVLMEMLLPCDFCFHAEHHLSPAVPHYWLHKFSADLEAKKVSVWKQSYAAAVKSLFTLRNGEVRSG